MAKSEHDWGTKEYDQEWVSKDSQRAAEREAQFNAAISWLSVFIGGQSRVMDLGCGPGTLAEKLLATFPEMSVICSDGSDEMLRLARQRLDASQRQRAGAPAPGPTRRSLGRRVRDGQARGCSRALT